MNENQAYSCLRARTKHTHAYEPQLQAPTSQGSFYIGQRRKKGHSTRYQDRQNLKYYKVQVVDHLTYKRLSDEKSPWRVAPKSTLKVEVKKHPERWNQKAPWRSEGGSKKHPKGGSKKALWWWKSKSTMTVEVKKHTKGGSQKAPWSGIQKAPWWWNSKDTLRVEVEKLPESGNQKAPWWWNSKDTLRVEVKKHPEGGFKKHPGVEFKKASWGCECLRLLSS